MELLIVMTIMLMVTAAAIPMILPATQNRRMREAARLVSSFISGARSRAIETGRPVGVMFERFNGLPFSMNLSYVEVPPPYAGDTLNSKITVNASGITGFLTSDVLWQNVVRVGDLVQLDYKGPLYVIAPFGGLTAGVTITIDPATTNWPLQLPSGGTFIIPAAYAPTAIPLTGVTFQIFRQPVRSSATPMQLPEGTVIDLVSSSMNTTGPIGTLNRTPPPDMPYTLLPPQLLFNPVFTFAPSGRVGYCTDNLSGSMTRPTAPIFLLLGRRELMHDIIADGTNTNLSDLVDRNMSDPPTAATPAPLWMPPSPNFWIAIGNTTGLVTVTEVAPNRQDVNPTGLQTYAGLLRQAVMDSRVFAQQAQSLGGR